MKIDNDTLENVFQLSLKKGLLQSIPEMDQEIVNLTSQIFVCLSKIIDFMPVTYYNSINSTLLSALYLLATFGSVNTSYNSSKLGLISMNCINELMSKASTFNQDANEFIYNVFQNTFLIIQLIVNSSFKSSHNGESGFDEIDEDYFKKFIDFLKLFISNHLGRFENFISFPTKDFLQLLFEFTTKMCHSSECYLMLLNTWSVYFDYLENFIHSKQKDKNAFNEKMESIKQPIILFFSFLLGSIQFSSNGDYLKHLDEQSNDDGETLTELENYHYQSIEVISKIAEIFTKEAIFYIDNYYKEKIQNIYYGLVFLVNNNKPIINGNINDNNNEKLYPSSSATNNDLCQQPVEQLQLGIRDFIIMLQVFSRFADFFVDNHLEKYYAHTRFIFDKLCEILHFIEIHNFSDWHRNANNPLLSDFLLFKAQIIATFKAYIVWFQQLCYNEKNVEMNQTIDHITIIINTCCSIICDNVAIDVKCPRVSECQQKMFHSAALTLNTFSFNIRLPFVFNLSSVQHLFDSEFQQNLLNFNGEKTQTMPSLTDQILISQSITNFLILPWFQAQEENWERRSLCLNMFISKFLQMFNQLNLNDSDKIRPEMFGEDAQKCPNVYCRSLYILKRVIKSHLDSSAKSKQLLLLSLNSSLEAFIQLLIQNQLLQSTVAGCQITRHILALIIVIFKGLLGKIGANFVEPIFQALLQIINRHIVSMVVHKEHPETSGLWVMIKFLKLLNLISGQASINASIRSILPNLIDLAVIDIQNNMISVKSPMFLYFKTISGIQYDTYHKMLKVYYQFLNDVVLNNCRYFFQQRMVKQRCNSIGTIATNVDQDSTKSAPVIDNRGHFETILEIFGQSFMHPENIELFRQNVSALEMLHEKFKLFERDSFREKFWKRFLVLFMDTLFNHSLEIINESLFTIIYKLAKVDFFSFYDWFIPNYISKYTRLNNIQCMELISNFKIDYPRNDSPFSAHLEIDLPTFTNKLNQLVYDVHFIYKCND